MRLYTQSVLLIISEEYNIYIYIVLNVRAYVVQYIFNCLINTYLIQLNKHTPAHL